MKGIDTNVLVRYIVQDDPKQSSQATHFIETACNENDSVFINGIVLCELVWVLESAYHYPKKDISNVLEKILKIKQFHIYQPEIVWKALHNYRNLGIDFSDCYIANLNIVKGCEITLTFDKKALRLKHFNHP